MTAKQHILPCHSPFFLLLLLCPYPISEAFTFLSTSSSPSTSFGRWSRHTSSQQQGPVVSAGQLIQSSTENSRARTLAATSDGDSDEADDEEAGVDLTAEFFRTLKDRDVEINLDDYDDDEEEDEKADEESEDDSVEEDVPESTEASSTSSDDDDEPADIPISKVNLFSGKDEGGVGKLAGNVTLTNRELYEGLKERVLESPAAFASLVGGEEADASAEGATKEYKPPDLTPDSGLTAGEVVELVLDALNHNDVPTENYGVEVLFAYSSPASFVKSDRAPTVEEYADFIKTSEYAPFFDHAQVIIDKADYSFDKKKAFYTVRLRTGPGRQFTSVNFILSRPGSDEDDCWLIDSTIIRTEGLGRGRRRR